MTETKAPRITKGRASTTMLNAKVVKSCSSLGSERLTPSVSTVFNHSRSVAAKTNATPSSRARTSGHLLCLAGCTLCIPQKCNDYELTCCELPYKTDRGC